jgi:hypothetical protein
MPTGELRLPRRAISSRRSTTGASTNGGRAGHRQPCGVARRKRLRFLGNAVPASAYDRYWLVLSLAELGRFAEAVEHQAEAIRLAESAHHPFTMGQAPTALRPRSISSKATGRKRARGSSTGSRCSGRETSFSCFRPQSPPPPGCLRSLARRVRRSASSSTPEEIAARGGEGARATGKRRR